jgi:N-carbamoylputrescine amidase
MPKQIEADRVRGRESIVTIACCQCEPKVGYPQQNLDKTVDLIEQAVKQGSNFIILPELANSGYVFNDIQEARELSEEVPSGKSFQAWSKLASDNDIYIVAGYNERDGGHLFNSSVFIGPDGHIGTHRKAHLWYEEKLWFEPGNLGLQVFETPIGKIGMHISYDQWFCEVSRIQAMQGADLIAVSTNWVPLNETEDPANLENSDAAPMANAVTIVNAHINKVWVAASDRIGVERGQPFLGRSIIVGPIGLTVAGPASAINEEILIARDCNLLESRARKNINEYNVLHADRRTELYDALLGYER